MPLLFLFCLLILSCLCSLFLFLCIFLFLCLCLGLGLSLGLGLGFCLGLNGYMLCLLYCKRILLYLFLWWDIDIYLWLYLYFTLLLLLWLFWLFWRLYCFFGYASQCFWYIFLIFRQHNIDQLHNIGGRILNKKFETDNIIFQINLNTISIPCTLFFIFFVFFLNGELLRTYPFFKFFSINRIQSPSIIQILITGYLEIKFILTWIKLMWTFLWT